MNCGKIAEIPTRPDRVGVNAIGAWGTRQMSALTGQVELPLGS
jgi:hypothetical protein